jgi:hypothetical protein
VLAAIFIVLLIAGIFAFDIGRRWWRQNEWKRRWRNPPSDD